MTIFDEYTPQQTKWAIEVLYNPILCPRMTGEGDWKRLPSRYSQKKMAVQMANTIRSHEYILNTRVKALEEYL